MSRLATSSLADAPTARPWLKGLLILLGYALLTVLFTRPLAWRATEGYVANIADNGDGSYNFNPYQLQNCLHEGTPCTYTHLQCFPHGNSLALNTNMPLPSLFAQPWANTTTGLNYILLLELILMGLGGYLFARLFLRSDWLAFIAGALGTFWMGRSAHLWYGHANLMFAASLPFALYALHRALPHLLQAERVATIKPKWAALFLLLGAVTILHDLILGGFLVIYAVLLGLLMAYRLWLAQRKWYWQLLVIGLLVVLVDQAVQWMKRWGYTDNAAFYYSGSLKNLFYPHPVSWLYNTLYFNADIHMAPQPGFDMGRVMFAGYLFILLTLGIFVYRLVQRRGLAQPWLLVVCVLGLLYTMPLIRWGNGRWLYGPFSLTHFIPIWNENRCPTRFMDLILFIAPVWVLANLEDLPLWARLQGIGKVLAGMLLLALLLVEHVPRDFKFADLQHGPAIYSALAKSEEPAAMFIPFGLVDGKDSFGHLWLEPLAYLPVHGRHMTNGYLSRIDEETWDFYRSDTFFVRLVRNQYWDPEVGFPSDTINPCDYEIPDSADMLRTLRRFQIRQVIVQPGFQTEPANDYVLKALAPFLVGDTTFEEGHRWLRLRW